MVRNPMASLLSLTQASAAGAPDPLGEEPEGRIVVEADKIDPHRYENPQAVAQRDLGIEAGREASDHKGMFGVKGTLRDVLGLVGDAFLIQSGNNPVYTPHKRQEEMSDAIAGFTEDPLAAIERVAAVNPGAAQAMMEQYRTNQYRTGQVDASNLRSNINAEREARMGREQAMDYVSQAYAAALQNGPEAKNKAYELAQAISSQTDIPLEELGVSENMTPQEIAVLVSRGTKANQTLNLPRRDRQLDISQQRADIAARNADRPKTSRSVSRQELFQQFRNIPRDERTKEEQDFIDAYTGQNRSNRGGGPRQLRDDSDGPTTTGRVRSVRRRDQ